MNIACQHSRSVRISPEHSITDLEYADDVDNDKSDNLECPSCDSGDSGFSSDDNNCYQELFERNKLVRSKSLRSALRMPTRNRSQKSVRFADVIGLNLVQQSYYEKDDMEDLK
ncbi:unnamed protein product [Dracunculus medinensis]|uniref:Uncharacterized protein n=1 Tax=Dracunculus medinensis TaxID=318479 RepID=A0A0N4U5A6_DRAME|nr:unnamed protein product [Dracunculus medinensis]